MAKISVRTAVNATAEKTPKGTKRRRRNISFHLYGQIHEHALYIGNQATFLPVIGSFLSPSETKAALRCSASFVNPFTPHWTASSLCLRSHACLNPIVHKTITTA